MVTRVLPPAAIAVDLAIFTISSGTLSALVVQRANPPYAGNWALPGGLVEADEGLDQAAARELEEETGLHSARLHIAQLHSYGRPDRDPRGRIVSVAYVALVPDLPMPVAGGDAAAATWTPVGELLADPGSLAFDHHQILSDAVDYLQRCPVPKLTSFGARSSPRNSSTSGLSGGDLDGDHG
ncbi:NUDIX hydrolase [Pseudonocardiaceae bacterium YIM PH 21723]|nr:NUDIX hydrolase [Pseudonocardiaceae bacterium YIM PH 21723]